MLKAALALLPALAFLGALVFLDSFKLVPLRSVLRTIAIGGLAAVACIFVNGALFAILTRSRVDRRKKGDVLDLLLGFLLAVVIHSAYNHSLLHPLVTTVLLIALLPPLATWRRPSAPPASWP